MPANAESLSARVQTAFRQLSSAASELNATSDELGKSITELDAELKKINLGVAVWVQFRGGTYDDPMEYWSEEIGYAKVGGKWGISLRKVEGHAQYPDQETGEMWLFNEAPRKLRLPAIEKIPELLTKMAEDASETAKAIRGKLAAAQEVAAAVKEVATPKKTERIALISPGQRAINLEDESGEGKKK